jgi:hypothetical protein
MIGKKTALYLLMKPMPTYALEKKAARGKKFGAAASSCNEMADPHEDQRW